MSTVAIVSGSLSVILNVRVDNIRFFSNNKDYLFLTVINVYSKYFISALLCKHKEVRNMTLKNM
jgi:hypothetical protein